MTTACPDCGGHGYIEPETYRCNCGGYCEPYYMHERYCGLEPCPRGCPFVPPGTRLVPADATPTPEEQGK